jgi:hypothetical protein
MRGYSRLLLLALVIMVTVAYPLLAPTPHRIDPAHFEMIAAGMTQAEVEAILGVPAGNYDWAEANPPSLWIILTDGTASTIGLSEPRVPFAWSALVSDGSSSTIAMPTYQAGQARNGLMIAADVRNILWSPDGMRSFNWVSRDGAFTVMFDANGRVSWKSSSDARIVPPWQRWWQLFWKR